MKQLIFILLVLLMMPMLTLAQEETEEELQFPVHTHETLKLLEYDEDIAETKDAEFLQAYLLDNILIGLWGKSMTRQYFAPSGSTWYQESEGSQSHGTWRVRDDAQYCSVWPPSPAESCYTVSFIDNVLYWHSGKNRYPSAIQIIENDESEATESKETEEEKSDDN